ncbi:MAG: hypothetical protein OXC01_22195 [Immundisolibacterales bacterium]|nr:hypothetical protein [Immundisolibacterales bacterium]
MSIVPVHAHPARGDGEAGPFPLSFEPCVTLFAHGPQSMLGTISLRKGAQRVHHHVVLDGAAARDVTPPDDRIGAQRKTESVTRFERRHERLRLLHLEQTVSVFRRPGGQNEKLPGLHFTPKKVPASIWIVCEQ